MASPAIGEGDDLVEEGHIAGLLDVLADDAMIHKASSEQVSFRPWMISAGLGVGTTVGSLAPGSLASCGWNTSGSNRCRP